MLDLLQQIDLLENFTLAKIILHELLLYCLDCYRFSSKLVHPERHFAECTLSDQLDELVEFECGRRQLVIFCDVILDVAH